MEALRIKLTQNEAHYRKEETQDNRMTYPLPPFSTVIGALHKACNFKEYHAMNISIQGRYGSLTKQAYINQTFFNSRQNDRGILVKVANPDLITSKFQKVAYAKKSMGSDFSKNISTGVYDKELFEEFRSLKNLEKAIDEFKKNRIKKIETEISKRKKTLKEKKAKTDKNSSEYNLLIIREEEIKKTEKNIKERFEEFKKNEYTQKSEKYQTLVTSLGYYEVLNDVELIIHIQSDSETLKIIENNIYNLKSIGRSEDFVEVIECEKVNLTTEYNKIVSKYSSFINIDLIKNEEIIVNEDSEMTRACGTKYFINKDYKIEEEKRIFNKVKVLYTSKYENYKNSKNIYLDNEYIVTFN